MDSDVETDPSDYFDLEIIGVSNPAPPSTLHRYHEIPIKKEESSPIPLLSRLLNPPTIKIEQTLTDSFAAFLDDDGSSDSIISITSNVCHDQSSYLLVFKSKFAANIHGVY